MNLSKDIITVDQHSGIIPNGLQIKIYVDDKTPIQTGIAVRDLILNNQAIKEKILHDILESKEIDVLHAIICNKHCCDMEEVIFESYLEELLKVTANSKNPEDNPK